MYSTLHWHGGWGDCSVAFWMNYRLFILTCSLNARTGRGFLRSIFVLGDINHSIRTRLTAFRHFHLFFGSSLYMTLLRVHSAAVCFKVIYCGWTLAVSWNKGKRLHLCHAHRLLLIHVHDFEPFVSVRTWGIHDNWLVTAIQLVFWRNYWCSLNTTTKGSESSLVIWNSATTN